MVPHIDIAYSSWTLHDGHFFLKYSTFFIGFHFIKTCTCSLLSMLIETLNVWKFLIVSSQSLIESISPEPTGTGEDKNLLFMQSYDKDGVTYVSI